MRKLSELLPIARQLLVTADDPHGYTDRRQYTCHAAELSVGKGLMAYAEFTALERAITAETRRQGGGRAIAGVAQKHGVEFAVYEPEYIAFRDQWLDTFQAKLQGLDL